MVCRELRGVDVGDLQDEKWVQFLAESCIYMKGRGLESAWKWEYIPRWGRKRAKKMPWIIATFDMCLCFWCCLNTYRTYPWNCFDMSFCERSRRPFSTWRELIWRLSWWSRPDINPLWTPARVSLIGRWAENPGMGGLDNLTTSILKGFHQSNNSLALLRSTSVVFYEVFCLRTLTQWRLERAEIASGEPELLFTGLLSDQCHVLHVVINKRQVVTHFSS